MATLKFGHSFPLVKSGRFLAVAAVHIIVIYAVATSLGIVKVPRLSQPMEAVLVDVPKKADSKPPVTKPNLEQPKIDVALEAPVPEIQPEIPVEVAPPDAISANTADTAPSADLRVTSRVEPVYSPTSRRASEQGTGIFRVLVDASGRPARIQVQKSTGFPRLDQSALDAIHRWKFAPATQGSTAIQSWTSVQVTFRLEH